jgi:hypothetical protein
VRLEEQWLEHSEVNNVNVLLDIIVLLKGKRSPATCGRFGISQRITQLVVYLVEMVLTETRQ